MLEPERLYSEDQQIHEGSAQLWENINSSIQILIFRLLSNLSTNAVYGVSFSVNQAFLFACRLSLTFF